MSIQTHHIDTKCIYVFLPFAVALSVYIALLNIWLRKSKSAYKYRVDSAYLILYHVKKGNLIKPPLRSNTRKEKKSKR